MAVAKKTKLTRSREDYLEAILYLVRKNRVARVRDIAARLGVGMSSVSTTLRALGERGLVNYDPYQVITLTDRGREIAEDISHRHEVLRHFLADVLGLPPEQADANACRMEHAVDAAMLERLSQFAEFIRRCPRTGRGWIDEFIASCRSGRDTDRCAACLDRAVEEFQKSRENE